MDDEVRGVNHQPPQDWNMDEPLLVCVERTNHVGYGSTRRLAPYTAMSDDGERRHDMGRRYVDKEIEHLRDMLTQRMDAERVALDLQAAEYERRLGELNHAHELAREAAALSVSRDKFDDYVTKQDERQGVSKRALLTAVLAIAGVLVNLGLYVLTWLRSP